MRNINRNKKIIILLLILYLNSFSLFLTLNQANIEPSAISRSISSLYHTEIILDGNSQLISLATNESWSGNGSLNNPYIISGYIFDQHFLSTNYLIKLTNIDLHLQIENCTFIGLGKYGSSSGSWHSGRALDLFYCDNITFHNNTIQNINIGINLVYSSFNTIRNNTINIIGAGISITKSDNNVISDNEIINCDRTGFLVQSSKNNDILNNKLYNSGFTFQAFSWTDIIQKNVSGNTVNGKPFLFKQNSNSGNISTETGQIVLVNCQNIIIENQNISDTLTAISALSCTNITITNSSFISNEHYGVWFYWSYDNKIIGNTFRNNGYFGLELEYTRNSILINNSFHEDGLDITEIRNSNLDEYQIDQYFQNNVTGNRINGKDLILWQNRINETVPENVGQIILINCSLIRISGLQISNVKVALFVMGGSDISISENQFFSTATAIHLRNTSKTELHNNTFIDSYNGLVTSGYVMGAKISWNCFFKVSVGIKTIDDHSNNITRNTFIGCSVWSIWNINSNNNVVERNNFFYKGASDSTNSTYRYNFWSDWISPDLNGDHIVDNPYYLWGSGTKDDFPLVAPEKLFFIPQLDFPSENDNASEIFNIRWTSENHFLNNLISYSIHFSANSGSDWILLESGLTNNSYLWDTTSHPNGANYKILIEVYINSSYFYFFTHDETFSVYNEPLSTTTPTTTIISSTTTTPTTTTTPPIHTNTEGLLTPGWNGFVLLLGMVFLVIFWRKRDFNSMLNKKKP